MMCVHLVLHAAYTHKCSAHDMRDSRDNYSYIVIHSSDVSRLARAKYYSRHLDNAALVSNLHDWEILDNNIDIPVTIDVVILWSIPTILCPYRLNLACVTGTRKYVRTHMHIMLSVELENLKADDILLDKIQVQTIIYSMESTIMSTCTQMCVYTYFEDFVIKDLTTLRKWNCQELVVF